MTQPNLPIISITLIMNYETRVSHYLTNAAQYLVLYISLYNFTVQWIYADDSKKLGNGPHVLGLGSLDFLLWGKK